MADGRPERRLDVGECVLLDAHVKQHDSRAYTVLEVDSNNANLEHLMSVYAEDIASMDDQSPGVAMNYYSRVGFKREGDRFVLDVG